MNITKVTVKYGRTFSLPGYSNVKPEFGYEAELEPGEDREAVKAELLAMAKAEVDLPELWDKSNRVETGWRYESLVKLLDREWSGYTIEDFSQNLEALPELVNIQLILTRRNNEGDTRYCIALPYSVEADDLGQQYRYFPRRYHTVFAENVAAFISKYAQDNEAELIDALDGDLSKLPDLTPKEAPAAEIEPDMEEPIEDDDDDEDGDDYNDDDDDDNDLEPNF